MSEALIKTTVKGRFDLHPGATTVIFDVAHNPAAAQSLAQSLVQQFTGNRIRAVFAALRDKELVGVIEPLKDIIAEWYIAPLDVNRGARVEDMTAAINSVCKSPLHISASLKQAYQQCCDDALEGELILVFGSFYTVAELYPEAV